MTPDRAKLSTIHWQQLVNSLPAGQSQLVAERPASPEHPNPLRLTLTRSRLTVEQWQASGIHQFTYNFATQTLINHSPLSTEAALQQTKLIIQLILDHENWRGRPGSNRRPPA